MSVERIGNVIFVAFVAFVSFVSLGLGLAGGCGGSSKAAGSEGGPCFGNETCNSGLTCLSKLCVNTNPTGGAGGSTGMGGMAGVGAAGAGGAGACSGLAPQASSCKTVTLSEKVNNEIDILFMIDDSSSMNEMQQKLYSQLPTFMNVLEGLPTKPNLHVAVVSSDMGAPGDSTSSIGCTQTGDQGQFQSTPRGTCVGTTLQNGATFISDDGAGNKNYTDANLSDVFQCLALLGDKGCGFEHQLASIVRALGADGMAAPSTNADFLRPEAYLGIVILTNEDDCSAPANTQLYSLAVGGSGQQNIHNALGPIANYRCNEWGHLCKDSTGNLIMPPLNPPTGATTLNLTSCVSNDTSTGLLTPVSQFVSEIKALKPDPDNQILVAAITSPPSPYTVTWVQAQGGQNTQAGEVWPQIEHSCGAVGADDVNPLSTMNPTDGSFGDPGVRVTQFANSFQDNFVGSICDASYASTITAIATKLGQLPAPSCITDVIQTDKSGRPNCAVVENVENNNVIQRSAISSCAANGNKAPCWNLVAGTGSCTGQMLTVNDTAQNATAQSVSFTVSCSVCLTNSGQTGCP